MKMNNVNPLGALPTQADIAKMFKGLAVSDKKIIVSLRDIAKAANLYMLNNAPASNRVWFELDARKDGKDELFKFLDGTVIKPFYEAYESAKGDKAHARKRLSEIRGYAKDSWLACQKDFAIFKGDEIAIAAIEAQEKALAAVGSEITKAIKLASERASEHLKSFLKTVSKADTNGFGDNLENATPAIIHEAKVIAEMVAWCYEQRNALKKFGVDYQAIVDGDKK